MDGVGGQGGTAWWALMNRKHWGAKVQNIAGKRCAALCDDGAQVMAASSSLWGCHAGRGDDSAGLPHFFVDLMQH